MDQDKLDRLILRTLSAKENSQTLIDCLFETRDLAREEALCDSISDVLRGLPRAAVFWALAANVTAWCAVSSDRDAALMAFQHIVMRMLELPDDKTVN